MPKLIKIEPGLTKSLQNKIKNGAFLPHSVHCSPWNPKCRPYIL